MRFAGTGTGVGVASTTGAGVDAGAVEGAGEAFLPLLQTNFFPDLMQVNFKLATDLTLPLVSQTAPALIAAEVEGITSKFAVTSKTTARANLRFTRKHYLLATLDHNTHRTRVATVVIPVSTVVTSRLPSSRNLVPTPPMRIPITVATLFSRITLLM